MFSKILIANRSEVAVRIIRACKDMDIRTVAVYSDADKEALHATLADDSICIGPARSTESYLNVSALVSAMEVTDAVAVHPGYGFLSENGDFAEVCENCGIKFIGPSSELIKMMGDKIQAKKRAEKANVPVLPWSEKDVADEDEAMRVSKEIGFPVIIKATAGGGGKGMKIVHTQASLGNAFHMAKREAKASFNNDSVFIEKFCEMPRHIEIQIMADENGNVVHLGERECSIQRRHQKVIEEAPSSFVDDELRKRMCDASVRLAKEIGYTTVGTVEYLVDKDKNFYFMEMNTRLQVEHPVTENITGRDIVKDQLRTAAGEELGYNQEDIEFKGHSLECRINAEDPWTYIPFPGKITALHLPGGPGVRVDSAIYCNYTVPSYYDPMIAKVITHGETRLEAIKIMKRALEETHIEGIKTNIPLLLKVLADHDFIEGKIDIDFLSRFA